MAKLRLSLACWNYDRTRALMEDRVRVDGIDQRHAVLPKQRREGLVVSRPERLEQLGVGRWNAHSQHP